MSNNSQEDLNRSYRINDSDQEDVSYSGQEHNSDANDEAEEELPMTYQEQQDAIQQLVDSMRDCTEMQDNPETSQYAKRFLTVGFYPDEAYRKLAAEDVARAIEAQRGPLVGKHHKHPYKSFATVADRLAALNNAYKRSKNIVKQALDPKYSDKLIDDPDRQVEAKKFNKKLNDKRNEEVKLGKSVLATRQKTEGDGGDGDDDDADETVDKKRTPKKVATPRQPKSTPAKRSTAKRTPVKQIKVEHSVDCQLRSLFLQHRRALNSINSSAKIDLRRHPNIPTSPRVERIYNGVEKGGWVEWT
jgi:hypothetical protein